MSEEECPKIHRYFDDGIELRRVPNEDHAKLKQYQRWIDTGVRKLNEYRDEKEYKTYYYLFDTKDNMIVSSNYLDTYV